MIQLVFVGKTKERFVKEGMGEFLKRSSRFCKIEVTEVSEEKTTKDENRTKSLEGDRILKAKKKGGVLICLDEGGKRMTSVEFAAFVKSLEMQDTTFAVGGHLGLSEDVKKEAKYMVSLSDMTFNHQMVRLFLVEQLYRAFAINNNIPYHR
ncbi:23S rRNA (pseudouridine(1915)-N(3))-methyltransferase RlmH [Candidatus Woesearchaeota archaeon CG11_big_fil_rev_8_21_14_0_20_43_8]|nr:MAG: 23S rRNA (pseudouridine(1915)-N(3))-methyltransferase RlmH [Candidatus Woesearchaeota archaeon CG11_big_fil_rev_8_21_14_0_20_43_8]